ERTGKSARTWRDSWREGRSLAQKGLLSYQRRGNECSHGCQTVEETAFNAILSRSGERGYNDGQNLLYFKSSPPQSAFSLPGLAGVAGFFSSAPREASRNLRSSGSAISRNSCRPTFARSINANRPATESAIVLALVLAGSRVTSGTTPSLLAPTSP